MYLHCLRPGETGDIWESPVTNVTERWERRESGNTLRESSLLAGAVDVDKSPSLKLKLYWLRLRSMKNAPTVAVTGRQNIPTRISERGPGLDWGDNAQQPHKKPYHAAAWSVDPSNTQMQAATQSSYGE